MCVWDKMTFPKISRPSWEKHVFSNAILEKQLNFSAKICIRIQKIGEKSLSLHHIILNHKFTTL